MLRRILIIIGVTLVVMLAIMTVAASTVMMNGFLRLERSFMERNLTRVQNVISDDLSTLGRTAQDWAGWDETYRFVRDLDQAYVSANLGQDTFANLRLNAMLFLDLTGRQVYGRSVDPVSGTPGEAPFELQQWFLQHPGSRTFSGREGHFEGIVLVPSGTYLVAARPIMDSALRQPIRGTLVLARLFDTDYARRLSASLRLSVSFLDPRDPTVPARARFNLASTRQAQFVESTRRNDAIIGYAPLRESGDPPLLMRVQFPRDIYHQGLATSRYFIAWLALIGVIFGAVVLIVIQRSVLSRLQQLSAGVLAIGTGGGFGQRVPVTGRDQIAYLGAAINGMLDALEGSASQLRQSEQRNAAFLDAIPDLILRISRSGTVIDARFPASLQGDRAQSDSLAGQDISELAARFPFVSDRLVEQGRSAIARALESASPQFFDFAVNTETGTRHYQVRIAASGDEEAVVLVRDITARKAAEDSRRRDIMVKEIHHRVKNNLQVISSLLALQASAASNERTRALLDESRNRVRSMALIHEKLYESGADSGTGYSEYVRDLVHQLLSSYGARTVDVRFQIEDIPLDMDQSVPLGLIINELVSNALSHAFPGGRSGTLMVSMRRAEAGMLELQVRDDGVGLPPGIDCRKPTTLGLRIVNILAQQIHADMSVDCSRGTGFTFTFPSG